MKGFDVKARKRASQGCLALLLLAKGGMCAITCLLGSPSPSGKSARAEQLQWQSPGEAQKGPRLFSRRYTHLPVTHLWSLLAGLPPGSHAAKERLDVAEAFLLILFCHTGRGSFVRSGTVEDDLPVLGERSCAGFKLVERNGSLKMILPALLLAVISTYEQCARV